MKSLPRFSIISGTTLMASLGIFSHEVLAFSDCSFGTLSADSIHLDCQSVLAADLDGSSQYTVQKAGVCASIGKVTPSIMVQGQFELKDSLTAQITASQWQWSASTGDDLEWNNQVFAARSKPTSFFDFENRNQAVFNGTDNSLTLVQIQRHIPTGVTKTKFSVKLDCTVIR